MKQFVYCFQLPSSNLKLWFDFVREVREKRMPEFHEAHWRAGIVEERWYLQKLGSEYMVLVYTKAVNGNFDTAFTSQDSEFTTWFRNRIYEIHKSMLGICF